MTFMAQGYKTLSFLYFQPWRTARDRCAAKGGRLATVRCAEEAKIVGNLRVSYRLN